MQTLILTGSDANYFDLAKGTLLSLLRHELPEKHNSDSSIWAACPISWIGMMSIIFASHIGNLRFRLKQPRQFI